MITAKSPSDPAPGLKFKTLRAALAHCIHMNALLETFDIDPTWNREYWKTKPKPWEVNYPEHEEV